MKVTSIKTHKITPGIDKDIYKILDQYLPELKENSIVVITSKIVAICEGRYKKIEIESGNEKFDLVKKESDLYLPPDTNKYNIIVTIKENNLVATAGIDESNGRGYYIFWPKSSQNSANQIRNYLSQKYKLKNLGVIITDSKSFPLKKGTIGAAIAHSGFGALNNYIGKPDIFDKLLKITKANALEGLAASAVLVMGEGNEQTPIALIEDLPFIEFQKRNPTKKELADLTHPIEDDVYAALLKNANWRKGKGNGRTDV